MGKRPKRNNGKAAGQFSEQEILKNTLKIFKEVCAKLAGPEAFKAFSRTCALRIITNRYPAIRLRGTKNCQIDAEQLRSVNEIFKNMVARENCETATGQPLPLNIFMREGLMLLDYVQIMGADGLPDSPFLKEACRHYDRKEDFYLTPLRTIVQIMIKFCVVMTDWRNGIFIYDINDLCALRGIAGSNEIRISVQKPQTFQLKINERTRELIRAGWPTFDGTIQWLSITPYKIGFRNDPLSNEKCDVFIQHHALQRLQERIGLIPGMMHEAINDTFRQQNITWHKRSEKRIIEYRIQGKKIGYLVCSLDIGKVVIRSFLFLTNTGTPEGNKLSELTKLEPLDKKYLEIDNLIGFAGYNIGNDSQLSDLFTRAGCEDLLDLTELIKFTKNEIKGQNTEALLKYFAGTLALTESVLENAKTGPELDSPLQPESTNSTKTTLDC